MRCPAIAVKRPLLLHTALLLTPLVQARAEEEERPLPFAAYYRWYHAPTNANEAWLHWTYPASKSNAAAGRAAAQQRGAAGSSAWAIWRSVNSSSRMCAMAMPAT
jgi:hypothetical protein